MPCGPLPLAALVVAGGVFAARMMQPPPDDLDLALTKPTEGGLYISSIAPQTDRRAWGRCTPGPSR
jgi:hypothetical protein